MTQAMVFKHVLEYGFVAIVSVVTYAYVGKLAREKDRPLSFERFGIGALQGALVSAVMSVVLMVFAAAGSSDDGDSDDREEMTDAEHQVWAQHEHDEFYSKYAALICVGALLGAFSAGNGSES